jgi:alkanesulfonate monooxygenase SsuD/methylene tetrahydromethanopterin reductase-like flavin-dependent oxidoreductase (luciferase family)
MTHWFPLGFDMLAHKSELLVRYCEEIGRDPAKIERTMATPVIVAPDQASARSMLERIPEERRAHVQGGTPEQAADALAPYIEAGFTGFTFNNPVYATQESIAAVGELLRLVS